MLRVRQRSEPPGCSTTVTGRRRSPLCDTDPVANVFVASRIRALGLDPGRLGAQMWGFEPRRPADLAVLLRRQPGARAGEDAAGDRRVRGPRDAPGPALLLARRAGRRGDPAVAAPAPALGPAARRAAPRSR